MDIPPLHTDKYRVMLPLLSLDTGVALQGVSRRGGQASADEEASTGRRQRASTPAVATLASNGAQRLTTVAAELRTPSPSPGSLARRWRESVRASMQQKGRLYAGERASIQEEIDDAQAKLAAFVRQAREGGDDALADSTTSTWDIAEKQSTRWQTLVVQSASFDRLIRSAQRRHDLINNASDFSVIRTEFAGAIDALVSDYTSQPILLESMADIIDAFIRSPTVTSGSFLNFMLMGNPGAGKTRLATALASVLGKLGVFVYDQLILCGRSDFVAEYEGQTAVKSRNFLMINLEKVVFLDEAYSLTSWQRGSGFDAERTLSAYSGEAVTEIVAFLSQRAGATCFIAAGYEEQMLNDFRPANPGIARRFPYMVWLNDYTPAQLIDVYLTAMADALSQPAPVPKLTKDVTRTYFTTSALTFLEDLLAEARQSTADGAVYPMLNGVFAAQAGAMVTLANVTALLIASSKRRGEVGLSAVGLDTWALGFVDVHDVLSTLMLQQFGPMASDAIAELQSVAEASGWLVGGSWQVPSSRAQSPQSLDARRRRR